MPKSPRIDVTCPRCGKRLRAIVAGGVAWTSRRHVDRMLRTRTVTGHPIPRSWRTCPGSQTLYDATTGEPTS